jgi:hypothetical protein
MVEANGRAQGSTVTELMFAQDDWLRLRHLPDGISVAELDDTRKHISTGEEAILVAVGFSAGGTSVRCETHRVSSVIASSTVHDSVPIAEPKVLTRSPFYLCQTIVYSI